MSSPHDTGLSGRRPGLLKALFLAFGAIILIASEIWLAAGLAAWSLVGQIGPSITLDLLIVAPFALAAIWATWKTVVLAIAAERDPEIFLNEK